MRKNVSFNRGKRGGTAWWPSSFGGYTQPITSVTFSRIKLFESVPLESPFKSSSFNVSRRKEQKKFVNALNSRSDFCEKSLIVVLVRSFWMNFVSKHSPFCCGSCRKSSIHPSSVLPWSEFRAIDRPLEFSRHVVCRDRSSYLISKN